MERLYNILMQNRYENILRWSDSGESFIIMDRTAFKENVYPELMISRKSLIDFTGFFRSRGFKRNGNILGDEFTHLFFKRGERKMIRLCNKRNRLSNEIGVFTQLTEIAKVHSNQLVELQQLRQQNNDLNLYLSILRTTNDMSDHFISEMEKYLVNKN